MVATGISFARLREFSQRKLLPRRHTVLLGALVAAFAARPLVGNLGFGPIAFSIALILLMLTSLYTVQVDELIGERETLVIQRKRRGIVGWLLAVPAIGERFVVAFVHNPHVIAIGLAFWLLFFVYITWNELRVLLKQREVTAETISLSISVYLLFGMTWAVLYILLYYLQPNAFSFAHFPSRQDVYPVLFYFSLVTISTVGFGAISPLSLQARYAAAAEAITGQFYLAILVARLVGLYMSRTQSQRKGD